jgi:hypothetical protein
MRLTWFVGLHRRYKRRAGQIGAVLPIRRFTSPRTALAALCVALAIGLAAGMSGCCAIGPELTIVNRCSFPVRVSEPGVTPDLVLAPHSEQYASKSVWSDDDVIQATFSHGHTIIEQVRGPAWQFQDPSSPSDYRIYVSNLGVRPYVGLRHASRASEFDIVTSKCSVAVMLCLGLYLIWMRASLPVQTSGGAPNAPALSLLPTPVRIRHAIAVGLSVAVAVGFALVIPTLMFDGPSAIARCVLAAALIAAWHTLNRSWSSLRRRVVTLPCRP